MNTTPLRFALACLVFASCSGEPQPNAEHSAPAAVSAAAPPASAPAAHCFQTMEDGLQFFPKMPPEITSVGEPSGGLLGLTDENALSLFNHTYFLNKAKYTVRFFDYCAKQDQLKADYERRYKSAKDYDKEAYVEMRDLDGGGMYVGYVTFESKNHTAYLLASIDGRIKFQIQSPDAQNMDDILTVFAQFDMEKFERLGK